MIRTVLIVRLDNAGDVLLQGPLVRAVAERADRVVFLAGPAGAEAARLLPGVDCLQLDVTRCGGYTGWLAAAAIAVAHNVDVSAHCAPALHVPVGAAVPHLRHMEYFIDHARLEPLLFNGVPSPLDGRLPTQDDRPGHGMSLAQDAERFRKP